MRSRPLLVLALYCLPFALPACKGGGSAGATGASTSAGGSAPATSGGSGLSAGSGEQRTDRAPSLVYLESFAVRATRELELADHAGALHKYQESLLADGQGQMRLDVTGVWDETTQSWTAPSQLLASLYVPRTFHLLRHRDLHLRHPHAYYSNYEWIAVPGVTQVAGVNCQRTRARSLRGDGDVELLHAVSDGLLLGWTMWDAAGTAVAARLTTTSLELAPDLTGVQWAQDQVQDAPYRAEEHDALLGMSPRSTQAPPTGYYLARRTFVNTNNLGVSMPPLYVEEWTDGLRTMFLAQHRATQTPGARGALRTIQRSQEGGVRVVEGQAASLYGFALGHLPTGDLELALAGLLAE